MSRIAIIDPVTGLVESVTPVSPFASANSVRKKAGAIAQKKGLKPAKIKSGNNYAG